MDKTGFINLAEAMRMSETKLKCEIGKRSKYLKEELGMDQNQAAYFVSSLLNLGAATNERIKEKKSEKK